MSRSAPPPPSDPRTAEPAWRPRLTGDLDALIDSPGARPVAADAYDALADLFLGESVGERAPQKGAGLARADEPHPVAPIDTDHALAGERPAAVNAEPVVVEGIILGHLPVTGVAWANQYARHVAERRGGPVAVLRLVAGQASLDLVGVPSGALDDPEPRPETLDEAVERALQHSRTWLIRVDEPTEPVLLEPGMIDAITLLTGVDEAAVVASYRTVKSLMEPHRDEDGQPTGPVFGLALMGAPVDKAESAASRLSIAAEKFLGRKLAVSAVVQKIGPGRPSVQLYRGALDEASGGAEGALHRLRTALAGKRVADEPQTVEPELDGVEPLTSGAEPTDDLAAAPDPTDLLRELVAPEPVLDSPMPAAGGREEPAPIRDRDMGAARPLARHLGFTTLRAACPYAPMVELAIGADGMLHLLAAAIGVSEREAVEQLLAASAWAAAHMPLLRLTGPDAAGLNRVQGAALHLFTEQAPAVRRLLDGDVRIHLLVRTSQDGREQWVCADLN